MVINFESKSRRIRKKKLACFPLATPHTVSLPKLNWVSLAVSSARFQSAAVASTRGSSVWRRPGSSSVRSMLTRVRWVFPPRRASRPDLLMLRVSQEPWRTEVNHLSSAEPIFVPTSP